MLPAILGLAGSSLAKAGLLGGFLQASPFLASALGSGIGSLLQGGTTDDALQAGLLGGIGGAIGSKLGTTATGTSSALGGDPSALVGAPTETMGASLPAGMNYDQLVASSGGPALASNMSLGQALSSPGAIGTALGASLAPPPPMKKEEDNFVAPRGKRIGRAEGMPDEFYRPGKDPEFDYRFPRNFQEGGIVDLAQSMEPEGEMNDKELINAAVDAIKGDTENAEIILGQFLAKFGEDALRDLVDKVQSGEFDDNTGEADGMVKGMGDGMDDMIPASMTDSDQDVLLSDGEFVVPADVVSGLGNGSSDAGADKLENMMDRVRELRTGGKAQPPDIPDEMMLPA
tara:strand:- start:451 stop:1482 length:1032 start_codon:yes stop_codon:yes gene_type:complete